MSLKAQDSHGEKEPAGIGSVALAGCKEDSPKNAPADAAGSSAGAPAGAAPEHDAHVGGAGTTEVKPGQLDTHYGLWSSGHTGDARILGIPSGRELARMPCFVTDHLTGWGLTNESKAIMGTNPDGSPDM